MSNRKKTRRPEPDGTVAALAAATRCPDCNSGTVRRRWMRREGTFELTVRHWPGCPVAAGVISPHQIPEAAARAVGGLRYERDGGGSSGGWVLNAGGAA